MTEKPTITLADLARDYEQRREEEAMFFKPIPNAKPVFFGIDAARPGADETWVRWEWVRGNYDHAASDAINRFGDKIRDALRQDAMRFRAELRPAYRHGSERVMVDPDGTRHPVIEGEVVKR